MVDDRRHLVVGADFQEIRFELRRGHNVDWNRVVFEPDLLKHDVDLMAVGRWPRVNVDHDVHASLYVFCDPR